MATAPSPMSSTQAGVDDPQTRFGLTAVWTDFNNDGKLDLFVTNDGQPNYLYQQRWQRPLHRRRLYGGSSRRARTASSRPTWALPSAITSTPDASRIAMSATSATSMPLFTATTASMNFTDVSYASGIAPPTTAYVGWGDAFLDFDNDGWPDLFLVNRTRVSASGQPRHHRQVSRTQTSVLESAQRQLQRRQQAGRPAIQIPQVSRGVAVGDLFNNGRSIS